MIRAVLLAAFAVFAACTPFDPATVQMDPRPRAQTQAEISFVKSLFEDIQGPSIREAREYCGLVGIDTYGRWVATKPVPGTEASCLPPDPDTADFTVVASYHTHGAYSDYYWNEIPSLDDMASDIADNTDGYVATPGGRFWYVDARARVARQICASKCLPSDPRYPGDEPVPSRLTLAQLQAL